MVSSSGWSPYQGRCGLAGGRAMAAAVAEALLSAAVAKAAGAPLLARCGAGVSPWVPLPAAPLTVLPLPLSERCETGVPPLLLLPRRRCCTGVVFLLPRCCDVDDSAEVSDAMGGSDDDEEDAVPVGEERRSLSDDGSFGSWPILGGEASEPFVPCSRSIVPSALVDDGSCTPTPPAGHGPTSGRAVR